MLTAALRVLGVGKKCVPSCRLQLSPHEGAIADSAACCRGAEQRTLTGTSVPAPSSTAELMQQIELDFR